MFCLPQLIHKVVESRESVLEEPHSAVYILDLHEVSLGQLVYVRVDAAWC